MRQERREFTRVPVSMELDVTADQQATYSGQTRDISLGGLYCQCPMPATVGAQCHVVLFLGGRDSEVRIATRGRVARVDSAGIGIEFTEVVGIESLEHLRNLVLYNATDPQQVEQEFASHLGIKRPEPSSSPPRIPQT